LTVSDFAEATRGRGASVTDRLSAAFSNLGRSFRSPSAAAAAAVGSTEEAAARKAAESAAAKKAADEAAERKAIKIVSASWDKTIKIWDLNTSSGQFSNTSTLTGHTGVKLIDSNNYNYICLLWNSIDYLYLFIYIYRIFEGCQR
jgi:hypothetical protein